MGLSKEPRDCMFLKKLKFQTNLDELIPLLDQVKWDETGRCRLNNPIGHWLYDPYTISNEWKDTAFHYFLDSIPYKIGEARLMKLEPGKCYMAHADVDNRYHLNLISNDQCYLIDLNTSTMHPIITDGILYEMDGSVIHTAVNFGAHPRVQLVIRVPLSRYHNVTHIAKKITVNNPPFDLRYKIDQTVSAIIGREIKQGNVSFFDPVSATELYLQLNPATFEFIYRELKKMELDFEVIDYD